MVVAFYAISKETYDGSDAIRFNTIPSLLIFDLNLNFIKGIVKPLYLDEVSYERGLFTNNDYLVFGSRTFKNKLIVPFKIYKIENDSLVKQDEPNIKTFGFYQSLDPFYFKYINSNSSFLLSGYNIMLLNKKLNYSTYKIHQLDTTIGYVSSVDIKKTINGYLIALIRNESKLELYELSKSGIEIKKLNVENNIKLNSGDLIEIFFDRRGLNVMNLKDEKYYINSFSFCL
ncbi:MAG: hypothetical protein ACK4K9_11530 [Bacteroidia bacterium]